MPIRYAPFENNVTGALKLACRWRIEQGSRVTCFGMVSIVSPHEVRFDEDD